MPFTKTDILAQWGSIDGKFIYDKEKTFEQNMEDLLYAYRAKPLKDSEMEQIMEAAVPHFKASEYAFADRKRAQELCARAQRMNVEAIAARHRALAELGDVSGLGGRYTGFFHVEGTDEARTFNNKFAAACRNFKNDPKTMIDMLFDEVEAARKVAGINSPEDFADMFDLSDEKLVEIYPKFIRYVRLVAEMDAIIKADETGKHMSVEQVNSVKPFLNLALDMVQVLENRMDIIANPFYPMLNPVLLVNKEVSGFKIDMKCAELSGKIDLYTEDRDLSNHPLQAYCNGLAGFRNYTASPIYDRARMKIPGLKDAVFSAADPREALTGHRTVVAHMKDGREIVLTTDFPMKIYSAEEYSKNLADQAAKTGRWLFTGSSEFSKMEKAHKALMEAKRKNLPQEEIAKRAAALEKAAKDYLDYKGVGKPYGLDEIADRGSKNRREQTRLETASKTLLYARAQAAAATNVIEAEKAEKEVAKAASKTVKAAPKPAKVPQEDKTIVIGNHFDKEKFLGDVERDMKHGLMKRKVPERPKTEQEWEKEAAAAKKTVEEIKKTSPATTPIIDPDDFALMGLMACGSDKVYFMGQKQRVVAPGQLENKGDIYRVDNTNPAVTYENMVRLAMGRENRFPAEMGGDLRQLSKNQAGLLAGGQKLVDRALQGGNNQELAQLLADGLKMNNKMLQAQKGITPEFIACAALGGKVLDMLEKYPAIKEGVVKIVGEQEMQIARAGKAINELHTEGLQAQHALINRFAMKQGLDAEAEKDMAKLCQMYGVERNIVGGHLEGKCYLADGLYGKIPKMNEQLNNALTGDEKMGNLLGEIKGKEPAEQIAAVKNARNLADIYKNCVDNKLDAIKQSLMPQMKLAAAQQKESEQAEKSKQSGIGSV